MQEKIFTIGQKKIAAKIWGLETNPPILALHGWLDNAASFDYLAPLLPNHYIIAIDFPGHGYSSHIPAECYFQFIDYVGDIIYLADKLGWKQYSLLGHSMGGAIATLVAGTTPECILKLGLLDALGPLSLEPDETPPRVRQAFSRFATMNDKKRNSYESIDAAVAARLRANRMEEFSAHSLVLRNLEEKNQRFHWRTDSRLFLPSLLMLTEEQVHAFLEAITAKTCFIHAKEGWPFGEDVLEKRLSKIKNLDFYSISGHHHIHMDEAARVARILRPFFEAQD